MDWTHIDTHRILGAWFNGLYALFNLAGAAVIFLIFGGMGTVCAIIGVSTAAPPLVLVGAGLALFGAMLTAAIGVPFLVNFVCAIGLAWYPKELWTTVISVIGALLALPVFPVGTLLGMHTLMVVFWEPYQQSQVSRAPSKPALVSA